jgi:hypothetical protein
MLEEVEYKDFGSFSGYFIVDGASGQTISGPYDDRREAEASICDRSYEPYSGLLVDGTTYGLGWS